MDFSTECWISSSNTDLFTCCWLTPGENLVVRVLDLVVSIQSSFGATETILVNLRPQCLKFRKGLGRCPPCLPFVWTLHHTSYVI